jgi:hypothetical protein
MPKSFLEVNGVYQPGLRFAFTNISDENFTSYWDKVPIIVKPHETIEISDITPLPGRAMGHNLAIKMTTELVDKIMINEIKMDEVAKNQPYYRSPQASSLGVPGARKPWEDKILREMEPDEESPAILMMKKQLKEEILSGGQAEASKEPVSVPTSISEFSEIKPGGQVEKKEEVKPAKTKTI